MPSFVDITGKRFGRLTVLHPVGVDRHGQYRWHCHCDCGGKATPTGGNLRSGTSESCGCLKRERIVAAKTVHGHASRGRMTPEYVCWRCMMQRCQDPGYADYRYWGGRGITICERWQSFENFLTDMGPKPKGLTIDRIDNEGNYEPGNCRWATWHEQRMNQRRMRV